MDYNKLADILFPDINETIETLELRFPERNLPKGACVTRFAPSPTGFMHVGGLYASLISSIIAHQTGGIFYLRIEDTDKKREVMGGVKEIISSLNNFGITFDEGMSDNENYIGEYGPYLQSSRKHIYQICAKALVKQGKAYPCFCTPESIEESRIYQKKNKLDIGYYGDFAKCRNLNLDNIVSNIENGIPFVLRFNAETDSQTISTCYDPVRGKIEFPASIFDTILLKSDGIPTYHFAHVVDDHFMRTTHVVRGDEWLSSYPIHEQLFRACEFELPKYIHIAPIKKLDGISKRKLSKRKDPEAAVSYYGEMGYPKESVIEYLLNIANSDFDDWRQKHPNYSVSQFHFKIEKMPTGGALFDLAKLDSVSREVISKFSIEKCSLEIRNWACLHNSELYDFANRSPDLFEQSISLWKGTEKRPRKDVAKWLDLIDNLAYIYLPQAEIMGYEFDEHLTSDKAKEFIEIYELQVDLTLDSSAWFDELKSTAVNLGYCTNMHEYKLNPSNYKGSIADMCALLRIVLTGKKDSPDLYTIIKILGKEIIQKRFDDFIEKKMVANICCAYVDHISASKDYVKKLLPKDKQCNIILPRSISVKTCLRNEYYGFQDISVLPRDMFRAEGALAISRFLKLATGKYSEIVGELEIRNQLEKAVTSAKEKDLLDNTEYNFFMELIRFADVLRLKYNLTNRENYSTLSLKRFTSLLGNLDGKVIMIVGAGYMAQSFYNSLQSFNTKLIIVNRSIINAKKSFKPQKYGGTIFIEFEELQHYISLVDGLFIAISNSPNKIDYNLILEHNPSLPIIDLSFPEVIGNNNSSPLYGTIRSINWNDYISEPLASYKECDEEIESYIKNKFSGLFGTTK
jgi:glutamyl-tRNA synthetase